MLYVNSIEKEEKKSPDLKQESPYKIASLITTPFRPMVAMAWDDTIKISLKKLLIVQIR